MENEQPKMLTGAPARRSRIWIAALVFVVLLALAAAVLASVRGAGFGRGGALPTPPPKAVFAEPTPDPALSEQTPVPTEEPTEEPTGEPTLQPFSKTEIFVDGRSVGVIASREAAEALMLSVEKHFEQLDDIPVNAVTELVCKVELWPAPAGAETSSYDSVFAYLTSRQTPLTYKSVSTYVEDKVIPHYENVRKDPKMLSGTRVIKVYGRDGLSRTVYRTVYVNGVKQEGGAAETYTVIEPVEGEIIVGTWVPGPDFELTPDFGSNPIAAYSLSFKAPVKGELIKFFGPYEGGFHQGIDVAVPAGEPVLAACSGKVVSILERGAYGLTVEIEHGYSVTTRYARMGSVSVSIGDKVAIGQEIGVVSGEDTVTHLHFELRVNGIAYNPLKVLEPGDVLG